MISRKTILSALVGAGLLAMPAGALASNNRFSQPAVPQQTSWQATAQQPALILADEDDWHHNQRDHDWDHHHDRDHDRDYDYDHDRDWYRQHPDYQQGRYGYYGPNDYNWGGRNRYQYPPSYFSQQVPRAYAAPQRRAYLEQRRATAVMMQRQMLARGDRDAANRLGQTIRQLNRALGY